MAHEVRWLADELATEALGRELAAITPPGGVWLLRGEMGAGKTTWVRGFVEGLGGDPEQVASPTYAVLHRYQTPQGRVLHLDLYRLGPTGAWNLGLEEELGPADRLVVEWPGTTGPWLPSWVGTLDLVNQDQGRQAQWGHPAL